MTLNPSWRIPAVGDGDTMLALDCPYCDCETVINAEGGPHLVATTCDHLVALDLLATDQRAGREWMRRHVARPMLSTYLSAIGDKGSPPPDHPNARLQVVDEEIEGRRLTAVFSPDPVALILAMRAVHR